MQDWRGEWRRRGWHDGTEEEGEGEVNEEGGGGTGKGRGRVIKKQKMGRRGWEK